MDAARVKSMISSKIKDNEYISIIYLCAFRFNLFQVKIDDIVKTQTLSIPNLISFLFVADKN